MSKIPARSIIPNFEGCIDVDKSVIIDTEKHFRRYGEKRQEAYVWWAGNFIDSSSAVVSKAFVFNDSKSLYGNVTLLGDSLRAVQESLQKEGLVLIAELHTHPPGANGQSYLDSINPATTYKGFISIIVPDFCEKNLGDLTHCFIYKYLEKFNWHEMEPEEIGKFLHIRST